MEGNRNDSTWVACPVYSLLWRHFPARRESKLHMILKNHRVCRAFFGDTFPREGNRNTRQLSMKSKKHFTLETLSRSKGIKTLSTGLYYPGQRYTLETLSRGKGIETRMSLTLRWNTNSSFGDTFPIKGNRNLTTKLSIASSVKSFGDTFPSEGNRNLFSDMYSIVTVFPLEALARWKGIETFSKYLPKHCVTAAFGRHFPARRESKL